MKKKIIIWGCALLFLGSNNNAQAQAFNGQGSKYTSIGWNISEINCWYAENGVGLKGRYAPVFNGISLQHERGLGDYGGLGFSLGAGFANNVYSSIFYRNALFGIPNDDYWSFVVPVGVQYNFHALQWVQDITETDLGGEKVDVFVGLGIGAGPAFLVPRYEGDEGEIGYAFFGDAQLGLRYYPKTNVGFYAQVGYGRSLLNVGVVFHK